MVNQPDYRRTADCQLRGVVAGEAMTWWMLLSAVALAAVNVWVCTECSCPKDDL